MKTHRVKQTKQGKEIMDKMRHRKELLDALAGQICYLARNNPRVSVLCKRGNKIIKTFSDADIAQFIMTFVTQFALSPRIAMEMLLKRCVAIDKNFVRNYNKFNKLCGNKAQIDPEIFKRKIKAAVAREMKNGPVEFVPCGGTEKAAGKAPKGRNITTVIDEMIAVIPPHKKSLIEILKVVKKDSFYKSPEQMSSAWRHCAEVLFRMVGVPKADWQKKVQKIFNAACPVLLQTS